MIPVKIYYLNGVITLKEIPKATVYIQEDRLKAAIKLLDRLTPDDLSTMTGFSTDTCTTLLDKVFEGDEWI